MSACTALPYELNAKHTGRMTDGQIYSERECTRLDNIFFWVMHTDTRTHTHPLTHTHTHTLSHTNTHTHTHTLTHTHSLRTAAGRPLTQHLKFTLCLRAPTKRAFVSKLRLNDGCCRA